MAKQKKLVGLESIEPELMKRAEASVRSKTVVEEPAEQAPVVEKTPVVSRKPGRPAKDEPSSLIPRSNGRTLFLEPRRNDDLNIISLRNLVDKQDVIRTALDLFLDKYMKGDRLNEEGENLVRAYYKKTHRH